ncbi:MAG TPA: hypothetical protein VL403_15565 [Candidatus Kryptonia bacterium]|nr:hypothetical protein [Candidatus Kryptonia bacterium]
MTRRSIESLTVTNHQSRVTSHHHQEGVIMFMFGFLCGAGAATWFILHRNGDLLIHLSDQIRQVARRYREWEESHYTRE